MKCEWCKREIDEHWLVIITHDTKHQVCDHCLDDYLAHNIKEFDDKLNGKWEEKEDDKEEE